MSRPFHKTAMFNAVQIGELKQNVWRWPRDTASFDLREVRVRYAGLFLNFAKRQIECLAQRPQIVAEGTSCSRFNSQLTSRASSQMNNSIERRLISQAVSPMLEISSRSWS